MPRPTHRILFAAVVPICFVGSSLDAQTTISWVNPVTGQWGTPSNWSVPYYPNNGNPPGSTYDVDIAATGPTNYLVTFAPGISVAVDSLTVNSPNATLYHFNSALTAATIDVVRGTYAFAGGTIRNAVITVDPAAAFRAFNTAPSDGFDHVTVASGAVTISNTGYLASRNGLTIADGASIVLENNAQRYDDFQTTLAASGTITGTGQILFGGSANPLFNKNVITASTLVIAPGITIRSSSSSGTVGAPGGTFLNQGTIASDVPGLEVGLAGAWTNVGSLRASNGGTLTLGGTWSNTGQIAVNNASLNLGGTFAASSLAGLTRTGTTNVTLTGTLANANSTLTLNDPSAPLLLGKGATVVGGTITSVVPGGNIANATLDAVTLDGDFVAPYSDTGGQPVIRNGLTLPAGRTLSLAATTYWFGLAFDGSQTISGAGQIVLDGTGSLNAIFPSSSADRLTFAPSFTVRTGTGGGTLTNVDNRGTVSAETPNRSISLAGSWSNSGTLHASNGGVILLGGALNPATFGNTISESGGLVVLAGSLNLAGGTLARTGSSATLGLADASTVSNGTLSAAAGASFVATAAGQNVQFAIINLNDVTLAGNFSVGSRAGIRFNTDLTLDHAQISLADLGESTDNGAGLSTPTAQAITGTGEITFDGTSGRNSVSSYGGTLTIGPDITVRTGVGSGTVGPAIPTGTRTVVNYGTISAQTPGQTLTLTGNNWSNLGTLESKNGATLNLAGSFTPASIGTLNVSAGGNVNIAGTLTLAGSTLNLSSASPYGITTGGNITTGTIASTDSTTLVARGLGTTLTSVTLNAPLSILPASSLTFSSSVANQPITASGAGSFLILAGSWSNNSAISVSSGGTLNLGGTPASIGTVSLADATLNLVGSYTAAQVRTLTLSNSTVRIGTGGNLNVAGDSFALDVSTGNVQLAGGRVTGGTVSAAPGYRLQANPATSSFLDGVTLAASLSVTVGATVNVLNGLTLSSDARVSLTNDAVLAFSGPTAFDGTGEVTFDGTAPLEPGSPVVFAGTPPRLSPTTGATSALTLGPNVTVRTNTSGGTVGIIARPLTNNGTISAETAAKSITVTGSTLTNNGTMRAINASVLVISAPSFTNSGTVTVAPLSTLVLTGGASTDGTMNLSGTAILNYTGTSPLDSVRQRLALGRAGVTGIILPAAASDPTRAIAYVEASLLLNLTGTQTATYAGQTVDATALLLKPTLFGDANFDGLVNADDYALLDRAFAKQVGNAHWTDGDFDYSGTVDQADYLLIDTTVAKQAGGPSPSLLATRESQFGAEYVQQLVAAVPEPSTLALASLALPFASRRRRR